MTGYVWPDRRRIEWWRTPNVWITLPRGTYANFSSVAAMASLGWADRLVAVNQPEAVLNVQLEAGSGLPARSRIPELTTTW